MSRNHNPAFELRVVPAGEREYRLALWQRALPANGNPGARARRRERPRGRPPARRPLEDARDSPSLRRRLVALLRRTGRITPTIAAREMGCDRLAVVRMLRDDAAFVALDRDREGQWYALAKER